MANLLARKPLKLLLEETKEAGEHSLTRTLGVVQLTALGVGAIIGAGIFVMAGLGAHYAGPGLMLSFVLSGLGCAFAGLCYAEFAAMIPLAGSAYTYAYATLGELFAWIIGWDLTLEYAMGASTVSSGWSNHFIELLNIFHLKMPLWLAYDHLTALGGDVSCGVRSDGEVGGGAGRVSMPRPSAGCPPASAAATARRRPPGPAPRAPRLSSLSARLLAPVGGCVLPIPPGAPPYFTR